jgi:hypothetical protein
MTPLGNGLIRYEPCLCLPRVDVSDEDGLERAWRQSPRDQAALSKFVMARRRAGIEPPAVPLPEPPLLEIGSFEAEAWSTFPRETIAISRSAHHGLASGEHGPPIHAAPGGDPALPTLVGVALSLP